MKKVQPRVLLSGFGPFPGVPENPTQAVIERLAVCRKRKGCELHTLLLPVEYGSADALLLDAFKTIQPQIVICLGVARSPWLRLERRALNLDSATLPDAAGKIQQGVIEPGAAASRRSTLPLTDIRTMLLEQGYPVKTSNDAGGYLCNHIFYRACAQAQKCKPRPACGFVHVPPADAMELGRLEQAVRVILRATLIALGHL